MNVHPEMKELLNAEMENGLKWWKKTTPTEIKNRLDKKLVAQQKALHAVENDGKELVATKVYLCNCLSACVSHLPWCEGKYEIVFERKNKEKVIDGRTWYYGVVDPGRYWGGI